MEGCITEAECKNALKNMEPEKCPDTDGLPSEFYKIIWADISEPLLKL